MTRDEAKQLLPVIQAYAEGKDVQFKKKFTEEEWQDALYLNETQEYTYRIKPQPKFRPFKNLEECWQEMQKHQPFGWVRASHGQFFVAGIRDTDVAFGSNRNWESYHYMFNEYTFADGQPFGILEE